MKTRGVLIAAVAALVLAAPASALRWLGDPSSPPPVVTVPTDFSVEATGLNGAVVTFSATATDDPDGSLPVSCSTDSGSALSFGSHSIECSATDSEGQTSSASFTVEVVDTTPPALSGGQNTDITTNTEFPTGTVVHYDVPTASDLQGSVPVSCSQAPDTNFSLGTTHVTCSADDGRGNSASRSFDVTVTLVDTTPPDITVPADIGPVEAAGPGGAPVNYGPVTASDTLDGTIAAICSPGPGSTFAIGQTTVTCNATDAHGNSAVTKTFNVTVRDRTPPAITVPSNIPAEATSPQGTTVVYGSVTATDIVDGTIAATCAPSSGSMFALGDTTVTCNATDAHGNSAAPQSFTVTVRDTTGPTFSGTQPQLTAEANGPTGSVVNYTTPTAVDTVDGPQLVSCSPASHTLFPLGSTTVQCTAADNHGNSSSASFQVAVVDTTPPTLAVPGPTTVYATTPAGIPETAPAFIAFRNAANADDIVDSHPTIGDNLGSFADVGTHGVGFFARDASGNVTAKATQLTVLSMPPAGTLPLPLPPPAKLPADVPNLQVFSGDGFVRLVWGAVPGAARYLVYRSVSGTRRLTADGHGDLVYSGTATTYTDRGLTNGVEYRYVVVSEDATGNQSAGVGSPAVPRLNLLHTPKDGAKVKTPPKLTWARNAEANYYNVQLFRGQAKILSTWPVGASLKLKRTWKYQGRRYTLTNGVYRWYVWPGFGARSAVDYGALLGSNSFQMTR
jgi:hypothetical protein